MTDFIRWGEAAQAAAKPPTLEDLLDTYKAIFESKPKICDPHVVSPRAMHRPGLYNCVNCGAIVEVKIPLSELG